MLEQPENRTCETVSSKSHLNEKSQNKVNRICNALLYFFQDQDGRYLQNEITAHTCKVPPDLETALRTVSTYRGRRGLNIIIRNTDFIKEWKKGLERKR